MIKAKNLAQFIYILPQNANFSNVLM